MNYLFTVIALILSATQIFLPLAQSVVHGGEESYFEDWSSTQEYTADYAVNLEKASGEDFKILSLTDIQLEKWESYGARGIVSKRTINYLVEKVKPDLIIMPGDNGYATSAYLKVIKDIDSFGIPWAPVMGNHDGSCCISEFWCALEMSKAENCLFKFGPKDMGYGNYIINITENGKIIHTLFMMDSHENAGGNINGNGYDNLWQNQIDWYEWAVKGTEKLAGNVVESTVVMHIPVVEFQTAWEEAYDTENNCYFPEYADTSYGTNLEKIGCPTQNNGFFELCQKLGSTKNIIVGHDHINDSSILYQGIRLTYSLKCGPGGYWRDYKNGGTIITIGSDGKAALANEYVPYDAVSFGDAAYYSAKWEV